jgi:hypothetical protein
LHRKRREWKAELKRKRKSTKLPNSNVPKKYKLMKNLNIPTKTK